MSQSGILRSQGPPPPTPTLYLEGDTGGPVPYNGSGVLFVIGSDNVTVEGDPGINTLFINVDGEIFSATTTDATPLLIGSVVVTSGDTYTINCDFAAIASDQSSGLGGSAFTVAYNDGASTTLAGGGHKNIISDVPSVPGECDVTFIANGNDVDVYIVGANGTTINWRMGIKIFASS